MFRKLKLVLLVGVCATWLPAMVGTASADETFEKSSTITAVSTKSFDIGFVDPVAGVYVLADRTNKAIDVIDTRTNELTNQLKPGFQGAVPFTAAECQAMNPPKTFPCGNNNDVSGPDGVLIVNHTEVWVGDGNSTVWVLQLHNGDVKAKISTALNGPGTDRTRADELCYDANDHIIMMANDASSPSPFVTFISSTHFAVLGHIVMDGTKGAPTATNGIEQCQWSPRTGKFYINLPQTGDAGLVLVIDPVSEKIEQTWSVVGTGCSLPQGMAIGPTNQILLGCNGAASASLIINEDPTKSTINVLHTLTNMGGNDQVWFNAGDDQYFLANSTAGLLGVADPDGSQDTPFASTLGGSHSVAVDPVRNQVYVPFNDGTGIGVYTAVGTDDPSICVGQGVPTMSVPEGTGDPALLHVVCPPRGNH